MKRPSWMRSIIFKVTLTYGLILLTAIAVMAGFIFYSTVGFMDRQSNTVIETDIEGLAEVYQRDGLRGLITTIEARIARDPGRSSIYLVADGRRVPVVGNISGWPNAQPNDAGWIEFDLGERENGSKTRARTRPFLLKGGVNLLVGRDIKNLQRTKNLIVESLYWATAIALAIGIVAGLFFTRRTRQRLETISQTSRAVIRGNLAERVPIAGNDDDLEDVACSLNAMLDEIQQLLHGIEHVSDNIAHDLRTPLSRLRNRLVALRDGISDDDQAVSSVDSCVCEVDQLLATFAALLRIAKLEAQGSGKNFIAVELRAVIETAIDLYEPAANERSIGLNVRLQDFTFHGERELLVQLVCNLLDNAIKFSPPGERIDVELSCTGSSAELIVADRGRGIDAVEGERLFERFYRGNNARAMDGAGLGLSLVRAVCGYHNAEISLEDNKPGLRARIRFDDNTDASYVAV